ncbi:MAG: restriction endonuclease subunit S, partial [Bacteroidaceae bacterium]|nr:restriction endonuclease subunit S [Bacteroidaceae bacterium]
WIGIIPKTWAIERMKGLFIERNERNCKGRTLLSVSQYFGIRPKSETDIADSHIAESYDDYKEVYQGDFVMNIMLAWNGSYAVSEYDGMVSPAYCVFKFRKDCCKKYFHYLLRTNGYPTAFKTMSRGVIDSRLRLYPEQFYTFPVIIPSVDEQQRISDYLDAKCGEIDSLIALQEQMIEKLKAYKQSIITEAVTKGLNPNAKLVPSGIDWIGEIPEGWEIAQLKRFLTFQNGQDYKAIETKESEGFPVYGSGGVFAYAAKYMYNGESVLFGRKGTVNKPLYVNCCFWTVDTMYYTIPSEACNCKFMYYVATTLPYDKYSTSTALPSMTQSILGNLMITIPPIAEQQAIASYLDNKCSEIDKLIDVKQLKIEKLKDYKKSVIYEAVTGKINIES